MRLLWIVLLLGSGCAARVVRMEAIRSRGQEVMYRNGTPVVTSYGRKFDVALQPKAGPAGRYRREARLCFLAAVRNLGERRTGIAALILATGNAAPARVLSAVEIEDEARAASSAAAAHAALAASAVQINRRFSPGASSSAGAAAESMRQASADARAGAALLESARSARLAQMAAAFERKTLEPMDTVTGALVLERDCGGRCRISITMMLEDESHTFVFDEIDAGD